MGKIYCTECGAELDDSVKFCSSCGTPIDKKDITSTDKITANNKDSNDNPVEVKEKSKKPINRKYLAVGAVLAIIIIILGVIIVTVTSPLYSADYTVDSSDYSVSSDKLSTPTFDREFTGSNVGFKENDGNGEIDVWHHSADGEDVDYYLKQYSTYDKDTSGNYINAYGMNPDYGVKIKNTKDITIDGVKGYIMDGSWGVGHELTWVIFVYDNEYYLISFDSIDQENQDKFLDSFKFKDN